MKPDPQSEIVQRLRCAVGHLTAVIEMTEKGRPCEQVLHQLNAVQAALDAAGTKLIMCQVENSQAILRESPSVKRRIAEIKRLQSLYTIFKKYSYPSEVFHD
jgi:DNA-binding FrmR family transcriptional regulator